MNKVAMALVGVFATTAAYAQTTGTSTPPAGTMPVQSPPVMTSPPRPGGPAMTATPGAAVTGVPGTAMGTTAGTTAPGDHNTAVSTTAGNAPQPAHGRNSFSQGEARRRIARNGFTQVTDLKKDGNGVWRGTGMKGGSSVGVWLDYKGNVGQQ